jgi:hypothetical protein
VSQATFYRWRQQYGALSRSELQELKELKKENGRLKKIVADLTLDKQISQIHPHRQPRSIPAIPLHGRPPPWA